MPDHRALARGHPDPPALRARIPPRALLARRQHLLRNLPLSCFRLARIRIRVRRVSPRSFQRRPRAKQRRGAQQRERYRAHRLPRPVLDPHPDVAALPSDPCAAVQRCGEAQLSGPAHEDFRRARGRYRVRRRRECRCRVQGWPDLAVAVEVRDGALSCSRIDDLDGTATKSQNEKVSWLRNDTNAIAIYRIIAPERLSKTPFGLPPVATAGSFIVKGIE